MAVQDSTSIDIVSYNPIEDSVVLVMAEHREWGDEGALLPQLQAKLNTYLHYVLSGRLACDYPSYALKPIQFDLRTQHLLSAREKEFLEIVVEQDLRPRGIAFSWHLVE